MIGYLKGQLIDQEEPGRITLEVNGVGYEVEVPLTANFQSTPHASIQLWINTIVREDAFLLYGFLHQEERALFKQLIKVNGVGPKLAMAILSSLTPNEFIVAIQTQDANLLTRLPGIGKKTAERLIVLMKDSFNFAPVELMPRTQQLTSNHKNMNDALQGLLSLGFKNYEAERALKALDNDSQDSGELIRQALKVLSIGK